ncbi:hypothetical protein [Amycolatopsis taiwanensis]|uniref:Uncharacterized protein n=1 Tax=Amycolatopsis taiwanensis TaxID=342230 RepID=A0A9W6RCI9_9PSEU|nr:hypothetical protein [Amycolatopsis taiwanensis]GLY71547.1 hypothetical protein Atai01_81660 [Amycolatopsis taiwanensis]
MLRFLLRFARNTTWSRYNAGVRTLARLARGTFDLFGDLELAGVDGDAVKTGFLFAFASASSAHAAWRGQRNIGAPVASGSPLWRVPGRLR